MMMPSYAALSCLCVSACYGWHYCKRGSIIYHISWKSRCLCVDVASLYYWLWLRRRHLCTTC